MTRKGLKTKLEIFESSEIVPDPVTLIKTPTFDNLVKVVDTSYEVGADSNILSRTERFYFVDTEEVLTEYGQPKIKKYDSTASLQRRNQEA